MNELQPNYDQIANSGAPSEKARLTVKSESENTSQAEKCGNQKRELLALWLFMAASFAGLGLILYGVWLKCQGKVPASPWSVP